MEAKEQKPRIGVFVCHCGTNISQKVNISEEVKFAGGLPYVEVATDYKYMCSEPGQELIRNTIKEKGLNRVVVASCSPSLHEHTFRNACASAGLNPYLFQMANIREHCAWVTKKMEDATKKAKRIIAAAVSRVARQRPLDVNYVKINPNVLVVGGGIAGIEASLRLASAGRKVYLVEREPSIGGHMALLDKTFPTLDCAACILTPKMSAVSQEKNIQLRTFSEVEEVSGYVGNFKVKVRHKSRFVDLDKCTGCGLCWSNCPTSYLPREREIRMGELVINTKQ